MPIPGMTQFEMLQARGRAIWEQSRDGTPGINPLGEWQARFEGRLDGAIDNTAGKVFNHHHALWKGLGGAVGLAGGVGAAEAYFDPHVARVMHNAAIPAAGALGLGFGALALNGMYAGKVKRGLLDKVRQSTRAQDLEARANFDSGPNMSTMHGSRSRISPMDVHPVTERPGVSPRATGSNRVYDYPRSDGTPEGPMGFFENDPLIAPDAHFLPDPIKKKWYQKQGTFDKQSSRGHDLRPSGNVDSLIRDELSTEHLGRKERQLVYNDLFGARNLGDGVVSKGEIAYEGYLKPLGKLLGRGALKTGEKGFGMIGGALRVAGGAAGAAMHIAAGMELSSRALLTAQPLALFSKNTPIMSNNMLDAYLPNFRNLPAGNVMKYAPNPSIIRRATAGMWAAGAISMAHEMIAPSAPPPTAVFDGRYLHHKNDMGANAQYGQAILGRNSELMDPQKIGMYAAHLL